MTMPAPLLESLEVLAKAKHLRDPKVILAVEADKQRVRDRRRPRWWLTVHDGGRED